MKRKVEKVAFATAKPDLPLVEGNLQASLGYAIRRAQMVSYQEFARVMSAAGIRPAQYALLVLIFENPGITQSLIGNTLGIEKGNLTGLLMELQKMGYTHRESVPLDRRAYSVQLTPLGKTRTRVLMKQHDTYEQQLASGLGSEEKQMLLALLARLGSGQGS